MADIQTLVTRIDALAERTGASPSTLSRKLFGNGNRIDEIKRGGSITLATYARAVEVLEQLEQGATA